MGLNLLNCIKNTAFGRSFFVQLDFAWRQAQHGQISNKLLKNWQVAKPQTVSYI
jgi:hypothetical protein